MSDGTSELERLEEEERGLSVRRRRLHDRIDFLRSGGEPDGQEGLAGLQAEERDLSRRRRELHARIDELRRAAGLEERRPARESLRDR